MPTRRRPGSSTCHPTRSRPVPQPMSRMERTRAGSAPAARRRDSIARNEPRMDARYASTLPWPCVVATSAESGTGSAEIRASRAASRALSRTAKGTSYRKTGISRPEASRSPRSISAARGTGRSREKRQAEEPARGTHPSSGEAPSGRARPISDPATRAITSATGSGPDRERDAPKRRRGARPRGPVVRAVEDEDRRRGHVRTARCRDPGATTGSPRAQSGHAAGSHAGTSRDRSAR